MFIPFTPAKFPESTHVFKGRERTPQEKSMGQVEKSQDLPVYVDNIRTISCWEVKNWRARLWFLITGKLWVEVMGPQPTMGVGVGNMFTVKSTSDIQTIEGDEEK